MSTKAELETQIKSLERANKKLLKKNERLNAEIEDREYDAAITYEMYGSPEALVLRAEVAEAMWRGAIENETGLSYWVATAAEGNPLCISSNDGEDPDFTLEIFFRNGAMKGVAIGDTDGNMTFLAGDIPAEAAWEEIRYARGERLLI
jgi:hypothetical protein